MGLTRASALCLVLAAACAVEMDWPRPPAPRPGDSQPMLDASGPAPGAGDGAWPDGRACPELTGSWSGALSGTISSGVGQSPVTGSVALSLSPLQAPPGDYEVTQGELTCLVKNLPSMSTKQPLSGTVHCGALDLQQQLDLFGVQAAGTVRCTFNEDGCQGTWTGNTLDGSTKGTGTFELRRN